MSRHKFALSSSTGLALQCARLRSGFFLAAALAALTGCGGGDSGTGAVSGAGAVHETVGDVVVVAEGFHSPRGLDFASNGLLFVAEAGDEPMGTYTETGAVSRVDYWLDAKHSRVPVLTGLPTYGDVGPADVSFDGMKGYLVIGLGTNANNRDALSGAKKSLLGSLISFDPGSIAIQNVADVSGLERLLNADGYANPPGNEDPIDSNPFGVLALTERRIVVDAGANAVRGIWSNGSAQLLAAFSAEGNSQHVPSRVAQGPDGYLYVGEEAFSLPQALIYKIPPGGCDTASPVDCKSHFLTDSNGNAITFGHIMDLEFDRSGNLYVLEFPGFGGPPSGNDLVKVDSSGKKTVIYSGLSNPGGMALSPDGRYAYVSNRTTCWGVAYQPPFPPGAALSCGDPQNVQPAGGPGLFGEVLRIALYTN
jgi:hypothetical protein